MDFSASESALAPMAAIALLLVTGGLGAAVVVAMPGAHVADPTLAGIVSHSGSDGVWLSYASGPAIPVDDAVVWISADGYAEKIPLADLSSNFGDGYWHAGEDVCIVGGACYLSDADSVRVRVVVDGTLVFERERQVFIPGVAPSGDLTICHKPGTPAEKTKTIPQSAWGGHEGHGDTLGAC